MAINLQDVLKAKKNIEGIVKKTSLMKSLVLSEDKNADVYLKLECQQLTGSFKLRGAANKIQSLTETEKQKGIIAASAGNHAQAVAMMAKRLGVKATIVIPEYAPVTKIENTKRYGAEVIVVGKDYDETEQIAFDMKKKQNKTYVHPYNDPAIFAGTGTICLEMLMEQPDLDMIIVPAGGGGLITGVATVAKIINPKIKIIGVQPVVSPPWYAASKNKKYVEVETSNSLADGLTGGIDEDMVDHFNSVVDDVVLVSEDFIGRGIYWLLSNHQIVAEGSGAIGIAAILEKKIDITGKKVGIVISGGNIDSSKLKTILNSYEE